MQKLSIPYSDDLLVATGKSKEALEQELRFLLAVKLFELRRLSQGKAAQLCGMPKLNFMDDLEYCSQISKIDTIPISRNEIVTLSNGKQVVKFKQA